MENKNSKGQAFIEMILSLILFLTLWGFVQNQIKSQKKNINGWEIGNETKIRFKTDFEK